jgi:hypothetical protein
MTGRWETVWTVNGTEQTCTADPSDFDLYRTERMLQGPREALQSWTRRPS